MKQKSSWIEINMGCTDYFSFLENSEGQMMHLEFLFMHTTEPSSITLIPLTKTCNGPIPIHERGQLIKRRNR